MLRNPDRCHRRLHAGLLCGGLLVAMAAEAAGGVYKWVDRNGVVRYDDQNRLAERMTRASIARGFVAPDAKATAPEELVAAVAQQCSDLRQRTDSYTLATSIYGSDPVGNQYRFSAYQVALEIARLRQESQRYCRPLAAQYLLTEARAELRRQEALKTGPSDP